MYPTVVIGMMDDVFLVRGWYDRNKRYALSDGKMGEKNRPKYRL